jgi:hypothetical protein
MQSILPTYILQGKTPIPEPDYSAWQKWFHTANRHVDDTMVGHLRISTVFIGLDHSPFGGRPRLFETMISNERSDDAKVIYQERCATWEEAEQMHKRGVEHAHALLKAR